MLHCIQKTLHQREGDIMEKKKILCSIDNVHVLVKCCSRKKNHSCSDEIAIKIIQLFELSIKSAIYFYRIKKKICNEYRTCIIKLIIKSVLTSVLNNRETTFACLYSK